MKVKIIEDCYLRELEKRINGFITFNCSHVYDIKYQDGNSCFSVIILYDEKEE